MLLICFIIDVTGKLNGTILSYVLFLSDGLRQLCNVLLSRKPLVSWMHSLKWIYWIFKSLLMGNKKHLCKTRFFSCAAGSLWMKALCFQVVHLFARLLLVNESGGIQRGNFYKPGNKISLIWDKFIWTN